MNTYEIENIAHQKIDSLIDEGELERFYKGYHDERPNSLPRTIVTTLAFLTFVGWVAQNLLLRAF